ncbi:hypothetical protein [Iodobacter fluviatilis]|uniref:Uncharacterized protein n=1 Tax=Iodobacter fluviatilis TaxID=537 RepID=A0A7G3GEJ8_9NEIS|nr:hypothetical protein [Iodobacter fluviatilis]QBC45877.1 hypothetical protein C1H71_20250 [Iodobacter fluviatilis]
MSDFIQENEELFKLATVVANTDDESKELITLVADLLKVQDKHTNDLAAVSFMPVVNNNPNPYQKRKCLNNIVFAMGENARLSHQIKTTIVDALYPNNQSSPYTQRLGDITAQYMRAAQWYKDTFDVSYINDVCANPNSNLINAAPKLLEVAQAILADDLRSYLPDEYITKVRAAIDKAIG